MAKRRIRTLLRSGWTEVKIPRKNLYKYNESNPNEPFGDRLFMEEIITWCKDRYDLKNYTYAMPPTGLLAREYRDCYKRFVFKNKKDATMFILKWL